MTGLGLERTNGAGCWTGIERFKGGVGHIPSDVCGVVSVIGAIERENEWQRPFSPQNMYIEHTRPIPNGHQKSGLGGTDGAHQWA